MQVNKLIDVNKKEYLKRLTKEKGESYVKENKGLLDAQYEYIETLGDPEDETGDIENVVISG